MSIKADVLAAALAALEKADLGSAGVAQFSARKWPAAVKEDDKFPLLLLSAEQEEWLGGMYGRDDLYRYPVLVTLVREGQALHDPEVVQTAREAVRTALFQIELPGAPTVWDCEYQPAPDFDAGAVAAGLDVSAQRFVYSSRDGGNT